MIKSEYSGPVTYWSSRKNVGFKPSNHGGEGERRGVTHTEVNARPVTVVFSVSIILLFHLLRQ